MEEKKISIINKLASMLAMKEVEIAELEYEIVHLKEQLKIVSDPPSESNTLSATTKPEENKPKLEGVTNNVEN